MQDLSGKQLQELHREYRWVQPVGEKYEEFQRVRQEVIPGSEEELHIEIEIPDKALIIY